MNIVRMLLKDAWNGMDRSELLNFPFRQIISSVAALLFLIILLFLFVAIGSTLVKQDVLDSDLLSFFLWWGCPLLVIWWVFSADRRRTPENSDDHSNTHTYEPEKVSRFEELIVPINTSKTLLVVLVASGFAAVGILFLIFGSEEITGSDLSIIDYGVGLFSIIFFGSVGIVGLKKVYNGAPGLIVNQAGLTDNAGGLPVGFLPWSDIERINRKYGRVCIFTYEPKKYSNIGGMLRRFLNRVNSGLYGTSIIIPSIMLEMSSQELHSVIYKYFSNYQNAHKSVP